MALPFIHAFARALCACKHSTGRKRQRQIRAGPSTQIDHCLPERACRLSAFHSLDLEIRMLQIAHHPENKRVFPQCLDAAVARHRRRQFTTGDVGARLGFDMPYTRAKRLRASRMFWRHMQNHIRNNDDDGNDDKGKSLRMLAFNDDTLTSIIWAYMCYQARRSLQNYCN